MKKPAELAKEATGMFESQKWQDCGGNMEDALHDYFYEQEQDIVKAIVAYGRKYWEEKAGVTNFSLAHLSLFLDLVEKGGWKPWETEKSDKSG